MKTANQPGVAMWRLKGKAVKIRYRSATVYGYRRGEKRMPLS